MVMVYYSERIQTKISKGKRHIEQSPEETRHKLLELYGQHLIFLALMSDNVYGILAVREVDSHLGI